MPQERVEDREPHPSEQALLTAARRGDPAAFGEIYDRYAPKLFNYCERLLGCPHDAADATQDVFTKMISRGGDVQLRRPALGPYLFAVARNVCFDQMHRRRRDEPVSASALDTVGQVGGRVVSRVEADPEARALLSDVRQNVREAHDRLPVRYREVLVMREVGEMTYDDIGAAMGIKRNAVAQLLFRARLRLGDELRGKAATSFNPASDACLRATTILARRDDPASRENTDAAWVREHLTACGTCRLSASMLEEAGASYRMLVPISAAAYLLSDREAFAAARGADGSALPAPSGLSSARRVLVSVGGAVACLAVFMTGTAESPEARALSLELPAAGVVAVRPTGAPPRGPDRGRPRQHTAQSRLSGLLAPRAQPAVTSAGAGQRPSVARGAEGQSGATRAPGQRATRTLRKLRPTRPRQGAGVPEGAARTPVPSPPPGAVGVPGSAAPASEAESTSAGAPPAAVEDPAVTVSNEGSSDPAAPPDPVPGPLAPASVREPAPPPAPGRPAGERPTPRPPAE